MHPLPGALPTRLSGFFCQATSTGGGAHHLTLLGRAVPPILLLLEGKGKGSHAYDSMAIRRLRPSSHARIFGAPGGLFSFGLLAGGFIIAALLIISGIVWDAGERLRGIIHTGCDERFGSASGDGLGGCVS